MACYRSGGCDPYEMYSCSECPASKPEYAQKTSTCSQKKQVRLIDANALMEAFRTYMVENHDREKCVSEENCNACERGCLWRKIVVKAPTIDPESLRPQGEWIGEADGYADGELVYDVWYCSECNYCIDDGTDNPDLLPNYCPNCGAKMKGGTP